MIGTDKELLLFLTWKRNWYENLDITPNQAHRMVDNLRHGGMSKEYRFALLEALGCVMIRDEITIQSVWSSKNITGSLDFCVAQVMSKWGWSKKINWIENNNVASNIKRYFREGRISDEKKEKILSSCKFKKIASSYVLPSIWEYKPLFTDAVSDISKNILARIICNPEEV